MRKFLKDKEQVKVVVQFRGREVSHQELGYNLLKRVLESLKDVAKLNNQPRLDGKRLTMVLMPIGK
jgi:translation initiation factor IF-3